uniref:glycine rich domain-containing protein n=1 Tax=Bacteroides ndongoniae TaxID=1903262 RepID=UPI0023F6A5D3
EQINSSYGASNLSQQGGGVSGRGQYPGTQNSAGLGGAFGLGANQTTSNYRYVSGAGGGGWYGGGKGQSDTGTNYVNYSGGGSGFVNTAANAGYRPSGYTGLQLDSGTTTAGNSSHPSTSGGTETGHSGNGYARITVLDN